MEMVGDAGLASSAMIFPRQVKKAPVGLPGDQLSCAEQVSFCLAWQDPGFCSSQGASTALRERRLCALRVLSQDFLDLSSQ